MTHGYAWVDIREQGGEDDETLQQRREDIADKIRNPPEDDSEPALGGYGKANFDIEEVYMRKPGSGTLQPSRELKVSGVVEDLFISLTLPASKIVEQVKEEEGIDLDGSGLFFEEGDYEEVRTKTADGKGRINLGKGYEGEDVRIVVVGKE